MSSQKDKHSSKPNLGLAAGYAHRRLLVRSAVTMTLCALMCAGVLAIRKAGGFQFAELALYDAVLALQSQHLDWDSPIVLIEVTEEDIQAAGHWPLTDDILSGILERLTDQGVRVIGLDIYRDIAVPPGTDRLESVLRANQGIIVVEKFGGGNGIGVPAPAALRGSQQVGFNDVVVDPGGIARRGLLFLDDGQTISYSFALRLALRYLKAEGIMPQPGITNPEFLRLGPLTLPPLEANDGGYAGVDARGYQILIAFHGGSRPFPTFSLADLQTDRIAPGPLRDKIVIVGVGAESVKDRFYTPHATWLQAEEGISGIELHAHVVDQLLRAALLAVQPVESFSEVQEAAWILLWSLLGGLVALRVRSGLIFAVTSLGGVLILAIMSYSAYFVGWWIPLVPAVATWLGSSGLTAGYVYTYERREQRLLMKLFRAQVSPEVAESIWTQRDEILERGRLRPRELKATILFSDIEGFTSISERLAPRTLMEWLDRYMEAMTHLVMEHGGVVDDYAGDGIKVDFGTPLAHTDDLQVRRDAMNAVRCGLAMGSQLERLNTLAERHNLPAVRMRMGINTGSVVIGTLGSAERMKFTTVGDAVNVASRLANLDNVPSQPGEPKEGHYRLLVSGDTLSYLDDTYATRPLGSFTLKGKKAPVSVYEITEGAETTRDPNN